MIKYPPRPPLNIFLGAHLKLDTIIPNTRFTAVSFYLYSKLLDKTQITSVLNKSVCSRAQSDALKRIENPRSNRPILRSGPQTKRTVGLNLYV